MPELYTRPDISEVTLELTAHLQGIALRGWQAVLPYRSEAELRHQFDPDNRKHLDRVRRVYEEHAAVDGLLLAYTHRSADPVGFALVREDVTGNQAARQLKRQFARHKVYAWVRHVCFEPQFQRAGRGRRLVGEALRIFQPEQIPTAYIFSENVVAMTVAQRLGFSQTPVKQDPKVIADYFGRFFPPVTQYRYAAPSVSRVIEASRRA